MKKLLFIVFIFCLNFCYGQNPKIKFEQIGINDGLSLSTVRCIFQDKKGFIWFGTKDGINQYDGYKFVTFKRNPFDKNSLSSNDVKLIIDDKDGNFWIATWDGGLNFYNPKTAQYKHFVKQAGTNSISSNFLESICKDDHDNIWIGTADDGLNLLNTSTNKFSYFKYDKNNSGSISNNNITSIFQDSKKQLWVGTSDGLNLYHKDTKKFTRFYNDPKNPKSLSDNRVKFIYEDTHHNLWIGTYTGGLNKLNPKTNDFKVYNKQNSKLSSNALLSIAEDTKGNLWIGTEFGGLDIFDPVKESFRVLSYTYNDANSISSNSINSVFKDQKGNMWLGTVSGGINLAKMGVNSFTHYRHDEARNSLSNNLVDCIFEDNKGGLWIGTDGGGMDFFDRKSQHFTNYSHKPNDKQSISGNYALTIRQDAKGNLWIGTWGDGVTVYNPTLKTYKFYKNNPADPGSLSNNYAFNIFTDSQNRIWIGTYGGGLELYNPQKDNLIHYKQNEGDPQSISRNNILTINEDNDHNILIGTDGAGFGVLNHNTNKFTFYTLDSKIKLSNNSVNAIYPDAYGNIWVGCDDGLDKLNLTTGKAVYYNRENGLPGSIIKGILPDHHGNLWISTENGLSKFDPAHNQFKNFSRYDGLQSNEFRFSECISRTGQMYFGGINGFNEFYPDSITDFKYDPPIVFTDFQVLNNNENLNAHGSTDKTVNSFTPYTSQVELSYKQSVLTVEFATLNFVNREKKKYAYMLEGFDNQWHYSGTKNYLTYTNLDPATYTLKVKGLNNDGQYSSKIAELKIIINPPYWKTWWFKSFIILLLVSLVLLIFYLRIRSIKVRNKQLEWQVSKRTQELKETNHVLTHTNEKFRIQNQELELANEEVNRKSNKIIIQQEHIITQNSQLENTVKELEKSNLTKDKFLSILAHDLRNPIAAIAGITKNLKEQFTHLSKNEISKYISTVNESSRSVHDLLINLLEWAKTQNQTLKPNFENVNLFKIITSNQILMEQLMRDKNIYFTTNINHSHSLYADKKMVETVVRNILSNCIKFTPPYGQISIESRETDTDVIITFYDTGLGMSDEQVNRLFDSEKTVSNLGSNGEIGSGLGLLIVKEFVEANKGTITISSLLNEGTTFTIAIPKGETSEERDTNDISTQTVVYQEIHSEKLFDQKKIKLQGKRLLYIDDNPAMRAYFKLILSPIFEFMDAENGLEGIKAAVDFQPEIIITDMLMPVMDGLELCKKLKHNPLTSHIPIILLTSQTEIDNQINSYEAGADTFLTKPVVQKLLFQVIYNLIVNRINMRSKFMTSENLYPDNFTYNARDKDFMDKVIAYIEENVSQPNLDHKKLCDLVSMSRTILYAKIKSLTGLGVQEFIQSIRVKTGLKLLMEGRLNINQISYEVGFNNPSYFSKCFTKQFDVPPKEYMNRLKKPITI